jgi:hypothetical protein
MKKFQKFLRILLFDVTRDSQLMNYNLTIIILFIIDCISLSLVITVSLL